MGVFGVQLKKVPFTSDMWHVEIFELVCYYFWHNLGGAEFLN